jgi:hypothetical protein
MSSGGQIVGGIVGAVIGWYTGGPAGAFKGAAIGAGVGGYIDPPPGPNLRGPALNDKSFQSSAYGVSLPRLYPTIATMGNIIYLENNEYKAISKKEEQGGKGGGGATVTTTTYFATFAVAFSRASPGSVVRRIWAGGKLIYSAGANDFGTILQSEYNSGMHARILGLPDLINPGWIYYDGTQTEPDSRMESVLGVGNCPSYEGTAYIIFYDFDLTDYGNGLAGCPIKVEITGIEGGILSEDVALYERVMPANIDQIMVSLNCPCSSGGEMIAEARGIQFSPPYNKGATKIVDVIDGVTQTRVAPEDDAFSYDKIYGVSDSSCWYGFTKNNPDPAERKHHVTNGDELIKSEDITLSNNRPITHVFDFAGTRFYIATEGVGCYFYINETIFEVLSDGPITDLVVIGSPFFCLIDKTSGGGAPTRIRIFNTLGFPIKTFYIDFDYTINSRCGGMLMGNTIYICAPFIGPPAGTVAGAYIIKIDTNAEEIIGIDTVEWEQSFAESVSPHLSFYYYMGVFFIGYITGDSLTTCRLVRFFYYLESPADAPGSQLSEIVSSELVVGGLDNSSFDVSNLADAVMGYRVFEMGSARGAISPLQAAYFFDLVEDGYLVKSKKRGQEHDETIPYKNLINSSGKSISIDRETVTRLPSRYSISYIDFDREYEENTEHADYPSNEINERSEQVAVVMSSDHAAKIADILINLSWVEKDTYKFTLPQNYLHLRPGDAKTIEILPGIEIPMRLRDVSISVDQTVEIIAVPSQASVYQSGALGNISAGPNDTIAFIGRSYGILLDIPVVENFMDTLGFVAAIYGQGAGWPGGVLVRSADNGQTYTQLQAFGGAGTMGVAASVLGADSGMYIDRDSALLITMLSGTFYAITEEQMMAGMHYCAYGVDGRWEILQYIDAQDVGSGIIQITGFVRGLRGTEWATGLHEQNDFFVLLDDPDNAFIGMDLARLNTEMLYKSVTVGQNVANAPSETFTYKAVNLKPLSVVSIVSDVVSGDMEVSWQPRTRLSGAQWSSGVPAPIGESEKKYEIDVYDADESLVATHAVTGLDEWTYTAAQMIEDFGAVPAVIDFVIYQISSTVGRGYPAEFSVSIPLWDPSALAVPAKIWLDETTAVTVVTGASQWDDRSGNGYHFTQSNTARQPTVISAAINGKRALRFDGADDAMFNDSTGAKDIMRNVPGGWLFVCFKRVAIDATLVQRCIFASIHTGSVDDRFTLFDGMSVKNQLTFEAKRLDSDTQSVLVNGDSVAAYQMVLLNLDYATRTGEIFVNGASSAVSTTFTTVGSLSENSSLPYALGIAGWPLGAGASPSTWYNDNIELASLLHGNAALSPAEVDKMFGWAAHNYGLTSLLPIGHPYKTSPPV